MKSSKGQNLKTPGNPKGKRFKYYAYTTILVRSNGERAPDRGPGSFIGEYYADTAHEARVQAYQHTRYPHSYCSTTFRQIIVDKYYDYLLKRLYKQPPKVEYWDKWEDKKKKSKVSKKK